MPGENPSARTIDPSATRSERDL